MSAMVSTPLASFIIQRRRELDAEAQRFKSEMERIADEREQLSRAAVAAGIDLCFLPDDSHPSGAGELLNPSPAIQRAIAAGSGKRSARVASEKTIKEAVIEILTGKPEGMTALDILAHINGRFGFNYPRTSLSPKLSNMKNDGELERSGLNWLLVNPSVKTNKAADEQSSAAPISQPLDPLAADRQAHPSEPGGVGGG